MNEPAQVQAAASGTGKQVLDAALDGLQRELPDPLCRAIRWLRNPKARAVRLPLGLLFIAASFFWFLPVVGIEFLPLGLLLIAIDVPFLQKPVGRATLWLEHQWMHLRARWRVRRAAQGARRKR
ncbi:MAG: hypothetical protein V4792_20845 [Pseudomonadota bacterium]